MSTIKEKKIVHLIFFFKNLSLENKDPILFELDYFKNSGGKSFHLKVDMVYESKQYMMNR